MPCGQSTLPTCHINVAAARKLDGEITDDHSLPGGHDMQVTGRWSCFLIYCHRKQACNCGKLNGLFLYNGGSLWLSVGGSRMAAIWGNVFVFDMGWGYYGFTFWGVVRVLWWYVHSRGECYYQHAHRSISSKYYLRSWWGLLAGLIRYLFHKVMKDVH